MGSLAVIIPVFNRPRAVLECLDSVIAQTRAPEEIVVVDDGSTDETGRMVRSWMDSRQAGRLLEQDCMGAAAARNAGLRATTADVLGFLDSDDLWPEDYVARAMSVLESDPQALAATASIERRRPGRPPKLLGLQSLEQHPVRQLFRDSGIGSATLVRRAALEASGGYDETVLTGHDLKLYLELTTLAGRWRHVPGTPVTKREGTLGPRLSDAYEDRAVRWARIYEEFAQRHPDADPLLARLVARRWFTTARSCRLRGAREEARHGYRRAIAHRPFYLRARLALALLPAAGRGT